jgi:type I restriction-modification system DNA methylase subunit
MLDLLPDDIWNEQTIFFDPSCKSGIFLVEIYNRLIDHPRLIERFPDKQDRRKHILEVQLYGLAIDDFSCMISQRNLYGCLKPNGNIHCISGYENIIKTSTAQKYRELVNKEFDKDMNFDVVVGNPPYNNDLYIPFVELGHSLAKECSLWITPAKWQAKGGDANDNFRKNIVPYMKK